MSVTVWGVFAAAGSLVSVARLERYKNAMGLSENEFWVAMWTLVIGGIVGAKVGFVMLGWQHYARGELDFWRDFGTGFVFFGGLAGALLCGIVFARVRQLRFARGADHFAVAVPLGHAIGRIGCYLQGCCHGIHGHPVQLYEAFGLLCIAYCAERSLHRVHAGRAVEGSVFRLYLVAYAVLRFILDPVRADGRPERYVGLSYPQFMALVIVGCALIWHYYANKRAMQGM